MSVGYNRKHKDRQHARSAEEKEVLNKIRRGILPRWHFKRIAFGQDAMERAVRNGWHRLTWRLQSTFAVLTKKETSNAPQS